MKVKRIIMQIEIVGTEDVPNVDSLYTFANERCVGEYVVKIDEKKYEEIDGKRAETAIYKVGGEPEWFEDWLKKPE